LGKWFYRLWQDIPGRPNPSAQAHWIVAEVCEVDFVPELGTILLLGGGLAGYAGLRWRTRDQESTPSIETEGAVLLRGGPFVVEWGLES
jgi:hypothetical protein